MPFWRCRSCSLILELPEPPDKCPKCGASKDMFKELTEEEVDLIIKSRRTNSLHLKALNLLEELLSIAEEGIKDGLDPACVKIFNEEKEFATLTIQKIKAELETHIKKGKWG